MPKPEAATESQLATDNDATNLSRTFRYLMGQFKARSLLSSVIVLSSINLAENFGSSSN